MKVSGTHQDFSVPPWLILAQCWFGTVLQFLCASLPTLSCLLSLVTITTRCIKRLQLLYEQHSLAPESTTEKKYFSSAEAKRCD